MGREIVVAEDGKCHVIETSSGEQAQTSATYETKDELLAVLLAGGLRAMLVEHLEEVGFIPSCMWGASGVVACSSEVDEALAKGERLSADLVQAEVRKIQGCYADSMWPYVRVLLLGKCCTQSPMSLLNDDMMKRIISELIVYDFEPHVVTPVRKLGTAPWLYLAGPLLELDREDRETRQRREKEEEDRRGVSRPPSRRRELLG